MALEPVTEGQTKPLEHQLLAAGSPLLIQGMTVALILETKDGTVISTTGKVTNLDDGTADKKGKVRFSPSAGDFVATSSPYYLQWKVTDGSAKIAYWPPQAERLTVHREGR